MRLPSALARRLPRRRWLRALVLAAGAVVVLFALAQAIPYGRAHTNPPVVAEPEWDSPLTRQLAVRACFDCHSNLTQWPWDSNVAPSSWLVQRDVNEGRSILNFSEWNRPQVDVQEIYEVVAGGGMPPWYYKLMHPRARLSAAERQQLLEGLRRTFAVSPPIAGGRRGD